MPSILLLNPNTHVQTTEMMVQLVQAQLPAGFEVQGVTARHGGPMITNAAQLAAAAAQVADCWQRAHWQREAAVSGAAQPTRQQVDAACGKARRAAVHCRENLHYPQRILVELQPRYSNWGGGL